MNNEVNEKLNTILDTVKNLEARISNLEKGKLSDADRSSATRGSSAKKLSIREFLLKYPPTTDIQRTLAIGYYLEMQEGMTSFTRADLERGYSDAKHKLPSNTGVNITHCIKAGNMMEAREKKDNKTAYVVTSTGEQFVDRGYENARGK